jgi:hypothetical protein
MEWTINLIWCQLTKQLIVIQAIHLQPHSQISNPTDNQVDQDVEPIERALLGSMLGIYCIPTVTDTIATVNSM